MKGNEDVIQQPKITLPKGFKETVIVLYGQTSEKIFESKTETIRKRKYSIIYYLNDHKFQIIEKKEDNSGILQGKYLKPMQIFKSVNVLLNPLEFRVGQT